MKKLFALAFAALMTVSATAGEDAKPKKERMRGSDPTRRITKALQAVELTSDQNKAVQAATAQFQATMTSLREAGLNQELMKKRAQAMKEARAAGLKGKEMRAKVMESVSAEEADLFAQAMKASRTLRQSIAKVLTDEQRATLPENVRRQLTVRQANAKPDKQPKRARKSKKEKSPSEQASD